ncbi:hypothetical protein TNCV_601831 [Trichonephila clavipes]|nr:hypothetical protein TNCV_601831 [Trichonephila clavipes]
MRYWNSLPPGGRLVEGEAERERNRSDKRARVEERRKGAKSPKRVREAPKRSGEKECCFFSQPEGKRKESASRTCKRNSRWKKQETAFTLIPVSTSGKGI